MPVDRILWQRDAFSERRVPAWPCPNCSAGALDIDENTLFTAETAESISAHDIPDWEPDWIIGWFGCRLTCRRCGEQVAVAGQTKVQQFEDDYGRPEYVRLLYPCYFSNPPPLITLPDRTPPTVAELLSQSFGLFWIDSASCANRIRTSIEEILTDRGVRRTELTGKQKVKRRKRIELHRRIEEFQVANPEVAKMMMAMKWLGNAGSHPGNLSRSDLLDTYEMVDHVLDQLYSSRTGRVRRIASVINKRRRPRSS